MPAPSRRLLVALAAAAITATTTACGPVADTPEAASTSTSTRIGTGSSAPAAVPPPVVEVPPPSPADSPSSAPSPSEEASAAAPVAPVLPAAPAPASRGPVGLASAGYPFGDSSVWRADISTAPVAANSAGMVSYLARSVTDRYAGVAALNVSKYNNSYFVAAPGTPTTDVAFDDCQGKGHVPQGLTGPGGQFTGVPIPAGAVPAAGDDKAMSIYSPETDQLWEFWVAGQDGSGRWSACWGGRIDSVSQSPGYFLGGFGASASGLATTGGMVSLADVRAGSIEHALALQIPEPAKGVSWPAQRSDGGNSHPDAVPEGTRLRLDPGIDVDALGLHPLATMIAKAAQQYGFIVTDHAGSVALVAESGVPEEAATGSDPWKPILGGVGEYEVLRDFPWDRLQALPADYGKP